MTKKQKGVWLLVAAVACFMGSFIIESIAQDTYGLSDWFGYRSMSEAESLSGMLKVLAMTMRFVFTAVLALMGVLAINEKVT